MPVIHAASPTDREINTARVLGAIVGALVLAGFAVWSTLAVIVPRYGSPATFDSAAVAAHAEQGTINKSTLIDSPYGGIDLAVETSDGQRLVADSDLVLVARLAHTLVPETAAVGLVSGARAAYEARSVPGALFFCSIVGAGLGFVAGDRIETYRPRSRRADA